MTATSPRSADLARRLVRWYRGHAKPLPWRVRPAPYRVWVGEVMSQQTTLGVAVPRFERLVAELPDVEALASCPDRVLSRLWAGLGYYARARNLRRGAVHVVERLGGTLPETYDGWLAIPGCGPYTAAMIASMCHGERVAAVDGNVIRVASRLLGLSSGVWEGPGQARIRGFAAAHVSRSRVPGDINQAFMELGQEVCTRSGPRCGACPVRGACTAAARGTVALCPPPRPRRSTVDASLTLVVIERGGRVLLATRSSGFLSGTAGLPIVAGGPAAARRRLEPLGVGTSLLRGTLRHTITHHRITARVLAWTTGRASARRIALALGVDSPGWVRQGAVEAALASALDRKAWRLVRARRSG